MKVLLDSNVLLYAMDKSSKYHTASIDILENKTYELFVSTKNIAEVFAVCSKINIDKILVLKFLENIVFKIATLIYPDKESFSNFIKIIKKYNIKGNQVYDMEIASIMLSNGINTIATFNHKDFNEISDIEILKDCILN